LHEPDGYLRYTTARQAATSTQVGAFFINYKQLLSRVLHRMSHAVQSNLRNRVKAIFQREAEQLKDRTLSATSVTDYRHDRQVFFSMRAELDCFQSVGESDRGFGATTHPVPAVPSSTGVGHFPLLNWQDTDLIQHVKHRPCHLLLRSCHVHEFSRTAVANIVNFGVCWSRDITQETGCY
ncbi:hypothetical protein BaRGS_00009609, partial [Batillaria attramentaria]